MTAKKKPATEHAKDAARAHTDLNIFHAAIALMEGSFISAPADSDAQRIIGLCRAAAQRCLRRYDAALANVSKQDI